MSSRETLTKAWDSTKEKATKVTAASLIALGAIGLAGCSDNAGAERPPQSPPAATAEPTHEPTETTPTPNEVETVSFEMTEADYESFANWDELTPFETHINEQNIEGTQAYVVDQFFSNHGLPTYSEYRRGEAYGNGQQLIEFLNDRREVIRTLNQDLSDPRNAEIAERLVEGIVWDSDESERFIQELRDVREGLVDPDDVNHPANYTYDRTTRYTSFPVEREVEVNGEWHSTRVDRFIVEYIMTNEDGNEMLVTEIIENSRIGQNPPRIWQSLYGEYPSASVDWGNGTIVELDQ